MSTEASVAMVCGAREQQAEGRGPNGAGSVTPR